MKSIIPEDKTNGKIPSLGDIGLTDYAPYLMNRIMGCYNSKIRKNMTKLGLSTAKMRALAVLSVIDGLKIGELANFAVVEQSTLSRAIDSLTRDGMVRRDADTEDNRATRLFITSDGRNKFESLWPIMAESYLDLFDGISEQERRAFVTTLQRILANTGNTEP